MASGALGSELAQRRHRLFVGRAAERELFEAALGAAEPPWSVLWLHGPGGVGKSSLLGVLAARARASGAGVAVVDGHDVDAADGFPAALVAAAEAARDVERSHRLVVVVDGFDRAGGAEAWLRRDWLPTLPRSALVVVAGREPPSAAWREDPAWRDLLRIVALRNLPEPDAEAYLDRCGVSPTRRAELIRASHGHPLALSLLADLAVRGELEAGTPVPWQPGLVSTLLGRVIDSLPNDERRGALEVCAIARTTTEDLLRGALGLEDATGTFEWLRRQSFVEADRHGLRPHDLARDVLDQELRWRDPERYKHVFRLVRAHVHRRLAASSGAEQRRAIADEKFVFRNLPSVLSPVDWASWGELPPAPARPDDGVAMIDLVRAAEGDAAAAIAAEWWARQPGAFHVVREPGGAVRGVLALLTLTDAGGLRFDPGARAAMEHAARHAPIRAGEVVTLTRFVVDRDRYQAPSPTLNATPLLTLQRYLRTPELAWDFLALFEPEPFDDYFALADLPRARGADFTVGGRRYGLYAHDFRRVPVHAWLDLVTERALAQDAALPAAEPDLMVLSHDAFVDAVRQALRDLVHPDRLGRNPLARSRLVAHREPDEPPGDALARVLREAIGHLGAHPRDAKRGRALDRTYVRPAPSQERAAEALGLPFGTYRRHLTEGVERVAAQLWHRELYGAVAPAAGD